MTSEEQAGLGPGALAILLGVLFGLTATSASALAVALPALADDLELSTSTSAWVMSCYALTLAVTTALHGRIADLVGIRRPFVAGIVLMSAGAAVAALAPSLEVLLAARLAQGAGAAAIPVLATGLISHRYDGAIRSQALGRLAGVAGAGSALGPLVGGALESAGGWRLTTLLPAAALLLLPVVWRSAPTVGEGGRLDLRGAAIVALAGTGLVLLVQSPASGLAVGIIGATLLVAGGAATARHVRVRPEGFLPRAVIGHRVVMASALAAGSCPVAWFALLIAVPALLVQRGWSSLEVGLGLVPSAIAAIAVSRLAGPVMDRIGERGMLRAGTAAATTALLMAAVAVEVGSPPLILGAVAFVTIAFGIGQPAMISAVGASVDPAIRGVAIGVATFVFLVGAGVGSAAIGGFPELVGTTATFAVLAALPVLGHLGVWRLLPARLAAPGSS